MSNHDDAWQPPPPPNRLPSTPALPAYDPSPATSQIPTVDIHPLDDDETIYAEEDEGEAEYTDSEEVLYDDEAPRRPWWKRHLPHETARFRRSRDMYVATAEWCSRIRDPRWYWWWRKRHTPRRVDMDYDPTTGWVHPWLIRKLHFKPLESLGDDEGETELRYVQRLHWIQPRTSIPQIISIIAWAIGITVWFLTMSGSGIVSKTIMLIVWLIGWFVYFMTGWLQWAYTFIVITNRRVIYDTWLPFRIPPTPSRNNLPIRAIINTTIGEPTWLDNIFGYNTLEFETAGSNKAVKLFEDGIKYVRDVDAIIQCTGAYRS